jgi:pimeloyl-ACP methyl ester carboxylesterase
LYKKALALVKAVERQFKDELTFDFLNLNSNSLLIYFHGFPGPRLGNLNESLIPNIQKICLKLRMNMLAPCLPGLIQSLGKFYFKNTVAHANQVDKLSSQYDNIYIIGYSWGAVTIKKFLENASQNKKVKKIALIAPLVFSMPLKDKIKICQSWREDFPEILNHYSSELQIVSEIDALLSKRDNANFYCRQSEYTPIRVFHGTKDEVIPLGSSVNFIKASLGKIQLQSYKNIGHNFENRSVLEKDLYDFFLDKENC